MSNIPNNVPDDEGTGLIVWIIGATVFMCIAVPIVCRVTGILH